MKTDELNYDLPEELIAQQALANRAESRLLVIDRQSDKLEHRQFKDIGDYLRAGDCLVVNESKVIPARFYARRASGGKIEGLFLELSEEGHWQVLLKNAGRLKVGETIELVRPGQVKDEVREAEVGLRVVERLGGGEWRLAFEGKGDYLGVLEEYGVTPLPPYIKRAAENDDIGRYQTVYAKRPGSAAAPTAGLHFTEELLGQIAAMGIRTAKVTLHVGLDTFKPVTSERLADHPMHSEHYLLDEENAGIINEARKAGGRIVAVGSTSVRVLETLGQDGEIAAGQGATRLFIMPGYEFRVVDAMITNFHLPRTTLLAMVCAFGGTERVLGAYREAVRERYRFFSYGDATLLV
ncbi:MAG: tRNA preQ1(34) S-adenosylmethionine ribosyltransferase-isomerase QueA [Sedimentisphaerales bacterium]|nr:tRNA preQ1(34) S-adenosylmethionine ribosyltransferase-isomerase QueA [Sedimentisphaerales bacterium]